MKRTILSILIGLTATTGAMAADSSALTGLNKCINDYANDKDIVQLINEGYSDTNATWHGLKGLFSDLTTREEQEAAIFHTKTVPAGYSEDYFDDTRRDFAKLYVALFLKYIAEYCPEYFISLSERFANDDINSNDRLFLFAKWNNEDKLIQIITKEEFDKRTNNDDYDWLSISLNKVSKYLQSNYYFLALPQDTATVGNWLTYKDGIKKLESLRSGNCGDKWTMPDSFNVNEDYVIDGIKYINIHKSFPGLIIKFNNESTPIVRDDNNGYIAINAEDYNIQQAYNAGSAKTKAQTIAKKLQTNGCNDMALYIATTEDPSGIVANYTDNRLFEKVKTTKTDETKISTGAAVAGGTALASGLTWAISSMLETFFKDKAAMTGIKKAAKAATRAAGRAGLIKTISKAVLATDVAVAGGAFLLGFLAITETYKGVTKDLEPVDIKGYEQLYIMYKVPLNTANASIKKLPQIKSNVIDLAQSQSSQPAPAPVQPVGNTGTPAESHKPREKGVGWRRK